jgi:hypothetical protein
LRRHRTSLPALLLFAVAASAPAPAAAQSGQSANDSVTRALARDPLLRESALAARAWLALLDEARYDSAWSVVAPAMRSVIGYEEWTTSLTRLRSVLPFRLRRELVRAERSVPLFGGRSVILSYAVGRGSMRELVVLVRSRERWLVGGYGILLY